MSSAENERLKAELEQSKLENDRIREDMEKSRENAEKDAEKEAEKDAEKDAEIGTADNRVDYNLVVALENELNVLREKCNILEKQYKINRRISPRKELKLGKAIEPPPMAPSETYVSNNEQVEISEGQLKVCTVLNGV